VPSLIPTITSFFGLTHQNRTVAAVKTSPPEAERPPSPASSFSASPAFFSFFRSYSDTSLHPQQETGTFEFQGLDEELILHNEQSFYESSTFLDDSQAELIDHQGQLNGDEKETKQSDFSPQMFLDDGEHMNRTSPPEEAESERRTSPKPSSECYMLSPASPKDQSMQVPPISTPDNSIIDLTGDETQVSPRHKFNSPSNRLYQAKLTSNYFKKPKFSEC
jgi:hypothetical protein